MDPAAAANTIDAVNTLETINNLILVVIPVITPLIISAFKRVIPRIPKLALPFIAIVIGALAGVLADLPAITGMVTGAFMGLSGVGVREIYDQTAKLVNK
jgi:MFS superfamily sulfate permease-like transporter